MPLELRHALRRIVSQPLVSLVVVAALALGVGANTAVFTVLETVVLRPLPLERPDGLVRLRQVPAAAPTQVVEVSYPDFDAWRRELSGVEDLAAFATSSGGLPVKLAPDLPRETLGGYMVTWNWFDLLGVTPLRGRLFRSEDGRPGAERVAVVSEELWRHRLEGGDRLGQSLDVSGRLYTVVGVVPAGVDLPLGAELWLPLEATVAPAFLETRGVGFLNLIARLGEGTTPVAATTEMDSILERTTNPLHSPDDQMATRLTPLADELNGPLQAPLYALFAISAIVLLLAVTNVANLRTVSIVARQRELALELALGAAPGRLLRQQAVESGLLGLVGGGLGLICGQLGLELLLGLSPTPLFRGDQLGLDPAVVGFGFGVGLLAALVGGCLPALGQLRAGRVAADLRGGRTGPGPSERRGLRLTVLVQTALATVLLVTAAVTLDAVRSLLRQHPGFERESLVSLSIPLPKPYQDDVARSYAFYDRLIERIETVPGVASAAAVLVRPLEGSEGYDVPFSVDSAGAVENRRNPFANYQAVTPGYFRTLGIPLLRGRTFSGADRSESAPVAVVSAAMAARYWPDSAVGRRLKLSVPESEAPWLEVVGVVGDVRHRGLEVERFDIYVPHLQSAWKLNYLAVRSRGKPSALLPEIRAQIAAIDPAVEPLDIATGEELVGRHVVQERFRSALVNLFALLALLLAAIGTYGVVVFLLDASRHELGLRAALGARPAQLLGETLRANLMVSIAGIGLGLVPSLVLSSTLLRSAIATPPPRPADLVLVVLLLGAVSFAACYGPARRASQADPARSLRGE